MPIDTGTPAALYPAGHELVDSEMKTWYDALAALMGSWTPYVPSLSGVTLGNGTLTGKYLQVGKFVSFSVALTWGSTTAWTSPLIGLPVTSADSQWVAPCLLYLVATSTSRTPGICTVNASRLVPYGTSVGGGAVGGDVSATHPFTWTTGSIFRCSGNYEAA